MFNVNVGFRKIIMVAIFPVVILSIQAVLAIMNLSVDSGMLLMLTLASGVIWFGATFSSFAPQTQAQANRNIAELLA